MGWLTSLFGRSETTEKIVDGVIGGVDAMFYTDEEKMVANQKILDFKLEYAKATTGQTVIKRVIASAVTAVWVLFLLVACVAKFFEADAFSDFMFKVMSDHVNTPFQVVLMFYFASHIVGKIKK